MEWQDTILSIDEIKKIKSDWFKTTLNAVCGDESEILNIVKVQAKRSWHDRDAQIVAGEIELTESLINLAKSMIMDYRKAGMNEVIEWLRKNLPDEYSSISEWSVWKAQIKEWKID